MRKVQLSALITLTALTLAGCGREDDSSDPSSTAASASENPIKAGQISTTPTSETNHEASDRDRDESSTEGTASTPRDTIEGPGNNETPDGTVQDNPPNPTANLAEDNHSATAPAEPATPPAITPDLTGTAASFTPCDSEGATAIQPGEINNTDLICVSDGDDGLQWEPR